MGGQIKFWLVARLFEKGHRRLHARGDVSVALAHVVVQKIGQIDRHSKKSRLSRGAGDRHAKRCEIVLRDPLNSWDANRIAETE